MSSRTYLCYIDSDNTEQRIYTVTTRSAMEAAKKYGRCEGGEYITVRTHSGQILSRVTWDKQTGKYINVSF